MVTHSDYALSIALNETSDPATPPIPPEEEGGNEFVTLIEKIDKYGSDFPDMRRTLLNSLRHLASFDDRVGDSFDIYANVRTVRFNEDGVLGARRTRPGLPARNPQADSGQGPAHLVSHRVPLPSRPTTSR